MNETRRFLRYVIPGLLFMLEVVCYLIISAHSIFFDKISKFNGSVLDKTWIAIVIGAFLTSGALGYLFSNIFHSISNFCHWRGWSSLIVDHRPLLRDAQNNGWMRIVPESPERIMRSDQAWSIVTAFWQSRIETSDEIKGANDRINSLTDIQFGLGASIIASVLSLPVWLCVHKSLTNNIFLCQGCGVVIAVIVAVLISIAFAYNYRVVASHIERVLYVIISDVMQIEVTGKSHLVIYLPTE